MEVKNLKATGIVRRIDDLGRLVIPKEIRKTLMINEGDPLEIFIGSDKTICIKKYDMIDQPIDIIDTFEQSINELDCITDIPTSSKYEILHKIKDIKELLSKEK